MTEIELLDAADRRARAYVATLPARRAFPSADDLRGLSRFDESLPEGGRHDADTLALLDDAGSPATVASASGAYFGFVVGGTLPAAAAAERMVVAWDQCASSFDNSPAAFAIERTAARWVLDVLDLPRGSAVSFGTSASACALACLTAARRTLLARRGWDFDRAGLAGAPEVRVVVSEAAHVTVLKALRLMGVGTDRLVVAAVDEQGRMDPARLPPLDDATILCLQAGEVNTGSFDAFEPLVAAARAAGAWVHVDGAFGLWARACPSTRGPTHGVEGADSWTTDGHKWLNTPYDGAMGICRDAGALAGAISSDAVYSSASADSQKNLGIEFSRRARGVAIWAALRSLGREGVAAMVDKHVRLAHRLASGLAAAGLEVLNDVVLNQVLVRAGSDETTLAWRDAAIADGRLWFGATRWQGRAAVRLSVSSWRTGQDEVDSALRHLCAAWEQVRAAGA